MPGCWNSWKGQSIQQLNIRSRRNNQVFILVMEHWITSLSSWSCTRVHGSFPSVLCTLRSHLTRTSYGDSFRSTYCTVMSEQTLGCYKYSFHISIKGRKWWQNLNLYKTILSLFPRFLFCVFVFELTIKHTNIYYRLQIHLMLLVISIYSIYPSISIYICLNVILLYYS